MALWMVLGGSGFLGAHVVRAALAAGHEVVCAARAPQALERVPGTQAARRARFDAREAGALARLLEFWNPEALVCCAALARLTDCEREPDEAERLNTRLPQELGAACAARGTRLVHVSTDLVFGAVPPPPAGFAESDPPAPVSAYGASKAAGERALARAHPAALVVRLPLLFGASFGRGAGASDALLAALARGERPVLFTDEWRTPLPAECAAEALVELAAGREAGLLHVAGPRRLSRAELGLGLLAVRGTLPIHARDLLRPMTREQGGLARRAADVSLDASRARALLKTELPDPLEWLARPPLAAGSC